MLNRQTIQQEKREREKYVFFLLNFQEQQQQQKRKEITITKESLFLYIINSIRNQINEGNNSTIYQQ
jgi:hypothetical protein